jgi:hypothetical protein
MPRAKHAVAVPLRKGLFIGAPHVAAAARSASFDRPPWRLGTTEVFGALQCAVRRSRGTLPFGTSTGDSPG